MCASLWRDYSPAFTIGDLVITHITISIEKSSVRRYTSTWRKMQAITSCGSGSWRGCPWAPNVFQMQGWVVSWRLPAEATSGLTFQTSTTRRRRGEKSVLEENLRKIWWRKLWITATVWILSGEINNVRSFGNLKYERLPNLMPRSCFAYSALEATFWSLRDRVFVGITEKFDESLWLFAESAGRLRFGMTNYSCEYRYMFVIYLSYRLPINRHKRSPLICCASID